MSMTSFWPIDTHKKFKPFAIAVISVILVLPMRNDLFVLDLPTNFELFSRILMYHFYVSQADYYNIEFICSSKKMLTHFLVSCILFGYLYLIFNVSAYIGSAFLFFIRVSSSSVIHGLRFL